MRAMYFPMITAVDLVSDTRSKLFATCSAEMDDRLSLLFKAGYDKNYNQQCYYYLSGRRNNASWVK